MGYAQTIPFSSFEIGSGMENPFTVDSVAGDYTFTDATITLPSWLQINRISHAYIDMYVPYIQNTNVASNYMQNTQYVYASVDGGAYHQCTKIFSNGFYLPPSFNYSGLYRVLGIYDMVSYLTNSCTISFLWDEAVAHLDSLIFGNVWFQIRIIA